MRHTSPFSRLRTVAFTAALTMGAAGLVSCSSADSEAAAATELRLGYFANVTHGPALVGVSEGIIQEQLGDTELSTEIFNAGPAAIEALSAGAIDAAYIGPNPSINTFIQSGGTSANVVSGATSGGAALVVRDGIDDVEDLRGTTLATPQLGNTQDVALRSWLEENGIETTTSGEGDVGITPTDNAQTLALFQQGELDGAWLPEPWVSQLVEEAGAHVLIDEAELWPDGAFPTTVLLVRQEFAEANPEIVERLVAGNTAAIDWIEDDPDAAATSINATIGEATGSPLPDAVLNRSLEHVDFTVDPVAGAFDTLMEHGVAVGTQQDGSIEGLFALDALNAELEGQDRDPVSDAGLGKE